MRGELAIRALPQRPGPRVDRNEEQRTSDSSVSDPFNESTVKIRHWERNGAGAMGNLGQGDEDLGQIAQARLESNLKLRARI